MLHADTRRPRTSANAASIYTYWIVSGDESGLVTSKIRQKYPVPGRDQDIFAFHVPMAHIPFMALGNSVEQLKCNPSLRGKKLFRPVDELASRTSTCASLFKARVQKCKVQSPNLKQLAFSILLRKGLVLRRSYKFANMYCRIM